MIIDCHCHAGKGDGLTGPWDTSAPLKSYLEWSKEAGIDRTVLFAAFHSDYAHANRQVSQIVNQQPERFYGFAFVHAARDSGQIMKKVTTAVKHYGFKGIKLHRYDARITREVCEVARSYNLPVLYDVMGEVSICKLLAEEYPDVNFIIPHLGSFADDWRAQLAFIPHLERENNIFTDSSGVRRFDIFAEAVNRAGAKKILFGSDGPWLHPGVELEKIYALKLTEKEQQRVLSGNILHLMHKAGIRKKSSLMAINKNYSVQDEYQDPWTKGVEHRL